MNINATTFWQPPASSKVLQILSQFTGILTAVNYAWWRATLLTIWSLCPILRQRTHTASHLKHCLASQNTFPCCLQLRQAIFMMNGKYPTESPKTAGTFGHLDSDCILWKDVCALPGTAADLLTKKKKSNCWLIEQSYSSTRLLDQVSGTPFWSLQDSKSSSNSYPHLTCS